MRYTQVLILAVIASSVVAEPVTDGSSVAATCDCDSPKAATSDSSATAPSGSSFDPGALAVKKARLTVAAGLLRTRLMKNQSIDENTEVKRRIRDNEQKLKQIESDIKALPPDRQDKVETFFQDAQEQYAFELKGYARRAGYKIRYDSDLAQKLRNEGLPIASEEETKANDEEHRKDRKRAKEQHRKNMRQKELGKWITLRTPTPTP